MNKREGKKREEKIRQGGGSFGGERKGWGVI